MEDSTQSDADALFNWYNDQKARSVDLVGDFAGQELFLVEGDSLLLHCFENDTLDFDYGFQVLHATYAVESFLQNLIRRKCNFHLAFFDDRRRLCIPRAVPSAHHAKYLLARAVILRHLRRNLATTHPSVRVLVFPSLDDATFERYLLSASVYFVLCHDGSEPPSLVQSKDKKWVQDLPTYRPERLQCRAMIWWIINRGFNVALINELEWRDSKVITMVVEGSRSGDSQRLLRSFEHACQMLESPPVDPTYISGLVESLGPPDPYVPRPLHAPPESKANETAIETETNRTPHFPRLCCLLQKLSDCFGPDQASMTERTCLVLLTLALLLPEKKTTSSMAAAVLLQLALMAHLPLSARRIDLLRPSASGESGQIEMLTFGQVFSDTSVDILRSAAWNQTLDPLALPCDLADLIDGRLLKAIFYGALGRDISHAIPAPVKAEFDRLASAMALVSGLRLCLDDISTTETSISAASAPIASDPSSTLPAVLPFSNAVFDEHLSRIKLAVDASVPPDAPGVPSRIFREITHWHNAKILLDRKKPPTPESERAAKRAAKKNQFLMAEMTAYAASLTNAVGKTLTPDVITVVRGKKAQQASVKGKRDEKPAVEPKPAASNKKGINSAKQAMLDKIAAQQEQKGSDKARKLFDAWKVKRLQLDAVVDARARYLKTTDYLDDLAGEKRAILETEVRVYMLHALLEIWIQASKADRREHEYATAALIWDSLRNLGRAGAGLTPAIVRHLNRVADILEMPLPRATPNAIERQPSFALTPPEPGRQSFAIALPPQDFQLLQCGPYMDRNVDSAPDARVSFEPDRWQRTVLDEIDADRSVFVVAPTSAGKTFISFYAMEKVLRADDNGVLVYVAPTKALVNQIAAEIQGRFYKKYEHGGKSVWAVHTRDHRINNPLGCQILVTVPHVLQIMLLAPTNANTWSTRVKRIIFDEIHCIGQAEDGVVWEQLLLLAPCPIIALSATVGNPGQFSSWLESTQKSLEFELAAVTHASRYSDLRKFTYEPPRRFVFNGLPDRSSFARLGLDGVSGFSFLHPVACLVNKSRGIPDDLTLEARDCLSLWRAMKAHETDDFAVPTSLDPAKALPAIIKKVDITEWEKRLKVLLREWMVDDRSPFDAVLAELSSREEPREELQLSRGTVAEDDDEVQSLDPMDLIQTTLPLLARLHSRDALPAILFNYDRSKCELMCQSVLAQLKSAEARWKSSSPKWKAEIKGWEAWKKAREKQKFRKPSKASAAKKGKDDEELPSKADQTRDTADDEQNRFESFDPDAPCDLFSFADKRKLQLSEMSAYFGQLTRKGVWPWLIEALTRGIGVHHAGMNRKYRQVVEILFRKGFLRVVIATGTLALGINMPCATVVFSGDSLFLTALNFRQAAGRAGRRGFDLLGNVVFQGISKEKVCRLLSSRLPDLNGHFPITTTLVLRLFMLLNNSDNSTFAQRAINSLLSQPRLYLGGESFRDQVLHHLRFSIEYLRRQGLITATGTPQNFAGCVSHLYYTENSSFAFHALLKEGYFHDLCSSVDTNEAQVLRTLMLVMSHLFGRRPCRQADVEYLALVKASSSLVFLPPLPEEAVAVLGKHNRETLEIFSGYVQTFAAEHLKEEEDELPLTKVRVGGEAVVEEGSSLPILPPTKTRSPFVALSGHGDGFASIADLCDTARQGIFLEKAIIPHMDIHRDELSAPLNAYLYDFFQHGDVTQLSKANGIGRGDVWFVLNDFSLVLATIITSLQVFMKLSAGTDLDMLDVIGNGDVAENIQDEDIAAEQGSTTGASSTSTAASSRSSAPSTDGGPTAEKKKKKKAVDEDWEAAAEDLELKTQEEERVREARSARQQREEAEEGSEMWRGQDERGLVQVLKAFVKLRLEFDTKFKKMWA